MSRTPTRNIALTPIAKDDIRAQVASGHHSKASEAIRVGLRFLMERNQAVSRPLHAEAEAKPIR